jgi:hypothetical protein
MRWARELDGCEDWRIRRAQAKRVAEMVLEGYKNGSMATMILQQDGWSNP